MQGYYCQRHPHRRFVPSTFCTPQQSGREQNQIEMKMHSVAISQLCIRHCKEIFPQLRMEKGNKVRCLNGCDDPIDDNPAKGFVFN